MLFQNLKVLLNYLTFKQVLKNFDSPKHQMNENRNTKKHNYRYSMKRVISNLTTESHICLKKPSSLKLKRLPIHMFLFSLKNNCVKKMNSPQST